MKQVVEDNIAILQEELQKKFGKKCKVIITKQIPACSFWVGRYLDDGTPVYYYKEPKELLAFMEQLIADGKIADGTLTHVGKIFFYDASGIRVR